jgi:16S rRNA (cytidine1402-2'-O)-methyltransferase
MAGLLSIVATPIGNLDDLSPRAARTLEHADVIACEDTRVTRKLLTRVSTRAKLVPYHAKNERIRTSELVQLVASGQRLALVTDAGTPGISDPGHRLVAACAEAGLRIEMIPGPSAAVSALVLSGLPSARFAFEGFLPRTATARRRRLREVAGEERTLVLFESPHRIAASIEDMLGVFGDRRAAIVRELTKIHEEALRGRLSELLEAVRGGVRGEVTVVVEGGGHQKESQAEAHEVAQRLRVLIEGGATKKEAIATVASELEVPKKAVYQIAIEEEL